MTFSPKNVLSFCINPSSAIDEAFLCQQTKHHNPLVLCIIAKIFVLNTFALKYVGYYNTFYCEISTLFKK